MPRRVAWTIALALAAVAAAHAWALRWTCDDAYISFRYAQNLVAGHGLVFNLDPAEPPVEGYSNFLWTLLLALGMRLGCAGDAIEGFAAALGALLHGATVLLCVRFAQACAGGRALLPVAAAVLAVHHHAASLAPAGLETALFTCLTAALALRLRAARTAGDQVGIGVLGVALAVTRPDGAIFAAVAGAFALHATRRERSLRPLLAWALPGLLLFVPFLLWRHATYGYWLPNTFYAKSGGDPYPGQGFVYVADFAACYRWGLAAAALALPCWWAGSRTVVGAMAAPDRLRARTVAVLLALVVPYLAFVVWVGGDFMFARFLLPVLPPALLLADAALAPMPAVGAAVALLAVVGTWQRREPPWLGDYTLPVSDNRAITVADMDPQGHPGLSRAEAFRAAGHYLQKLWAGEEVRIGIGGGQANLAYRTGVPVAIECATGLTDAYIAHLPVAERGKVGHEKTWTHYPDYLHARGMQVMFDLNYQDGSIVDAARDIVFPSQPMPTPAKLVRYDRALIEEWLRRDPGVHCLTPAQLAHELDRYLDDLPKKPRDQVVRDFAALRRFWFDHNDDPVRRARFEEYLREHR